MKKLIAVISAVILSVFACMNVSADDSYFHHEEKSVKTAAAPVIDGVFSQSEWSGAAKFVLSNDKAQWKSIKKDSGFATGDIYYLWDDDYLYIACDIKDTTKSNYSDYNITKTDTDAVLIALNPLYNVEHTDLKGCYLLKLDPYTQSGSSGWYELYGFMSNDASHGITVKSTLNEGVGYIIEARVPWTFFSAYEEVYYSESGYEQAEQQSGFKKPSSKVLIKTEHSKRIGVAHILVDMNENKEEVQFYGDFGRDSDSVKSASMYNVLALATDASKKLDPDPNLPKTAGSFTSSQVKTKNPNFTDLLKLILPLVVIVILSFVLIIFKIIKGSIAKKKEKKAFEKGIDKDKEN